MSLDGTDSTRIKDNTFTDKKTQYIYVYQDKVYYDDGEKIYKMDTNGDNFETFIEQGHGMMKIYNNILYYFNDKILKSIPLDKSTTATTVIEKCACYIDSTGNQNFYVNPENTIFYSTGTELFRKKSGQTAEKISEYHNDNFVFAKDFIYFRDHAKTKKGIPSGFYGISKGIYDTSAKEIQSTIVRETDEQVHDKVALNISSSWIVYYNRVDILSVRTGKSTTQDLRYVSLDGNTERILVKDVTNGTFFDSKYMPIRGVFQIIEDYVYYILGADNKKSVNASIHRIKNDGTDKKKLVDIIMYNDSIIINGI